MTRRPLTAGLFLLLPLAPPCWGIPEPVAVDATRVLVAYDVTLPSGKIVSLVSPPGELSQITLESGKILAIGLALEDPGDQAVSFRLLEGRQEVAGAELSWKQVEKFTLRPGATYSTAWQPTLSFHLKSLKPPAPASKSQTPAGPSG